MKIIVIPNLDKYQHYKDRNIIWIKLYVDILQDYKFCQLKNGERSLFIGLILLAVKNDNKIPLDVGYITREVCFSSRNIHEKLLILKKLNLIAIKRISKRYQKAIPIREDKIIIDKKNDGVFNKFLKDKEGLKEKLKWK